MGRRKIEDYPYFLIAFICLHYVPYMLGLVMPMYVLVLVLVLVPLSESSLLFAICIFIKLTLYTGLLVIIILLVYCIRRCFVFVIVVFAIGVLQY